MQFRWFRGLKIKRSRSIQESASSLRRILNSFISFVTVFDDFFTCDDSDEISLIINYRDRNSDWSHDPEGLPYQHLRVPVYKWRVARIAMMETFSISFRSVLLIFSRLMPHRISPLGNRAGITAIHTQKRNTGEFAVLHLLYSLAKCLVLKYIGYITFGCQEK